MRKLDLKSMGIFLYRLNDKGDIIADTWHLTVEEAKEQAAFEYGVEDEPHTFEGMQVGYRSECGVVIIFNKIKLYELFLLN